MRIDAALADEAEIRQALKQRRADFRALADQHQNLGIAQTLGERVDVLDVIVPNRYLVAGEHAEASQRSQRVVIVVEDRDFHEFQPSAPRRNRSYLTSCLARSSTAAS